MLIHHLRLNTPTDEEVARVGVQYSANLSELLEYLRNMLRRWQVYLNHYESMSTSSYHAEFLREMRLTWQQCADILFVSIGPYKGDIVEN